MLEQLRAQLRDILDARGEKQTALDAVLETPTAEERTLNDDERAAFNDLRGEIIALDEKRDALSAEITELEDLAERRSAAEKITVPADAPKGETRVAVNEPDMYRRGGDHDFVADMIASRSGDAGAARRIDAHNREARAGDTTDWTGVVVPQYLLDMYAPKLRSGRPFINAIRNLDLPSTGMVLTIPMTDTASTVAHQTQQNTSVSETDITTTNLTVPVNTYAGQQVVSRQAVKRGAGVSELIIADLFSDYAAKTNVAALTGTGTAGDHKGVVTSTLVTTSALTATTAMAAISKIAGAAVSIQTSIFEGPDLIVMHPRRWAWLATATDTAGRPLGGIEAGQANVYASGDVAATGGFVGTIMGIPVITDAGVPTNLNSSSATDPIIVTKRDEVLWWEEPGAPFTVQLDEVLRDQLSVRFVLEGYSAFTAERRPGATVKITGTGLVPPAF